MARSQISINLSAVALRRFPARHRCMMNCHNGISAKVIQAARNELRLLASSSFVARKIKASKYAISIQFMMWKYVKWTPEMIASLGKETDAAIAKSLGVVADAWLMAPPLWGVTSDGRGFFVSQPATAAG